MQQETILQANDGFYKSSDSVVRVDFRQPPNVADARRGRFMIVSDIESLDDCLDGNLPDDVVAFAFRRMVLEFRLGRALDDDEAAYKLHKHATTARRLRRQHPEFLALMDGASGHARHKFSTRKLAKSSNFRGKKPNKNNKISDQKKDPSGERTYKEGSLSTEGTQRAPDAVPCLEASTAPAQEGRDRASPAAPSAPRPPIRRDHFADCACPQCSRESRPPPVEEGKRWDDLSEDEKAAFTARMAQARANLRAAARDAE